MNNPKTSLLPTLVIGAFLAACAPAATGPPEIVLDQTPCARCSMLISEPRYAAAYRVGDAEKVFDDIGCLLRALDDEPSGAEPQLWFRDVGDGSWVGPDEVTFVRGEGIHTPMAGGIVATVHQEEVERLRASMDITVYASFEELRAARAPAHAAVGGAQ